MNKTPFITAAEAIKEDFKGRTNYWVCHREITNAVDIQICRAVLPPGEAHNFHHHPSNEEAIYVLEGQVEQWVDTQKQVLNPGDVAHIPAGVVHGTFNVGSTDAVILAILSPANQPDPITVDVSTEAPWSSMRA